MSGAGPSFDAAFREGLATLFRWRRDVRRFRREPLAPGVLGRLLELANGSPSVGLSQPWRFVLVEDAGRRAVIRANFIAANAAALAAQGSARAGVYARLKLAGLEEAPVHLGRVRRPGAGGGRRAWAHDAARNGGVLGGAGDRHGCGLAARAEGVGLGWVSILDPAAALVTLDVPAGWGLVAYLCLGYPAEEAVVPELERAGWEVRRGVELLRR